MCQTDQPSNSTERDEATLATWASYRSQVQVVPGLIFVDPLGTSYRVARIFQLATLTDGYVVNARLEKLSVLGQGTNAATFIEIPSPDGAVAVDTLTQSLWWGAVKVKHAPNLHGLTCPRPGARLIERIELATPRYSVIQTQRYAGVVEEDIFVELSDHVNRQRFSLTLRQYHAFLQQHNLYEL